MSTTGPQQASINFGFLAKHDRHLVRLAGFAELYCVTDPNTALVKLRQFIERLTELAGTRLGTGGHDLKSRIDNLYHRRCIEGDLTRDLHSVRIRGNQAVHEMTGTAGDVVHALKRCRKVAIWYARTFGDRQPLKAGPFVVPKPPVDATVALEQRLAETRAELTELEARAADAEQKAAFADELRRLAEAQAQAAAGDAEAALELAEEDRAHFEAHIAELQTATRAAPPLARKDLKERSRKIAASIDATEAETRRDIDTQLRAAGWQADSQQLTYARGARPRTGENLAIAEWPSDDGRADYVLFHGLTPLAVVEAKRRRKNAAAAIDQSRRYSRAFRPADLATGGAVSGSWGEYRIPFLFATNGRPFLREVLEESGIWFLDARRATNHPYALKDWYTPEGLRQLLRLDSEAADRSLKATPADDLPLRDYQVAAVRAVESAIAAGRRQILLAMATGTGKTRTTIGLLYRLIRAERFRRALFVVDRGALGEQAGDAFVELPIEAGQSFASIYDLRRLGDLQLETDTRLQIATVQSLVRRVLYGDTALPVDAYDCIVIDECHRGYTLDREMGEELAFRDQADYISKYRRALDHFDAVKIGLTATPALHTTQIFGDPVYEYGYRQAVIDGYLVDHGPPIRIETRLARDGIHWHIGEEVKEFDPGRGQTNLFHAPDEIDIEVEDFNRSVITENFNRAVCGELARHIDPRLPGKTLVFCVNDRHAMLVVRFLKDAFTARYGDIDDQAVQKITGSSDRPLEQIRHFRNEAMPSVAVTVDLLTTGVDVTPITRLVFLRRVKSRILYDQMVGRATRLCEDLYGRGEDKELFNIFDAVDLYATLKDHTDMKPVVANPRAPYRDLVDDLSAITDVDARARVHEEIIAKLQRQRRRIQEHHAESFEEVAGLGVADLIDNLRHMTPDAASEYFRDHHRLTRFLDRLPRRGIKLLVSEHEDEVIAVDSGYGKDRQRPEDYLESFGRFLEQESNRIPALLVVTQRPRELTRSQLKELKLALDEAGYGERQLRAAWNEWKNQDIAASIIGFIRQRALGDALRPYAERVDAALQSLLASRDWTGAQRQWLGRIGKQMKHEIVVDREAFDRGELKHSGGGFQRLDKVFDGGMEEVLARLHEGVWAA